jgi:hypothetical protein
LYQQRGFPHTGVLCFAGCALLLSITLLFGAVVSGEWFVSHPAACQAQGFLIQFFGFAVVMYYLCICVQLACIVLLKGMLLPESNTQSILVYSHQSL